MKGIIKDIQKGGEIILRLLFLLLALYCTGFNCLIQAQRPVVNHDISTGHLVIDNSLYGNDYVVTGSTPTYQIIVGSGYVGTITLSNVSITSTELRNHTALCGNGTNVVTTGSCMAIMGLNGYGTNLAAVTKVNLVLEGDNFLTLPVNDGVSSHGWWMYSALQVDQGAQIHISAINPCEDSSGTLFARSLHPDRVPGVSSAIQSGAAIGAPSAYGTYNNNQGPAVPVTGSDCGSTVTPNNTYDKTMGGNIIISSGTITAWGGHGAGIGGGYYSFYDGVIIITGGIVDARTTLHSAGIGSGCPINGGVKDCYTQNSAILALPPAYITAYGIANAGTPLNPDLALAGTRFITYVNDPNRPQVVIRTSDNVPNANIFIDITGDVQIQTTLSQIYPEFEADKIWLGRTDVSGKLTLNAYFQNPVRFFTDAVTSDGRFYGEIITSTAASGTNPDIVLMLEAHLGLDFISEASIPLCEGYTAPQADAHAFRAKIKNTSVAAIPVSSWVLQSNTDFDLNFYDGYGTPIAAPASIAAGDSVYVSIPIQYGRPASLYEDRLIANIGGVTRPVLQIQQRVGCLLSDIDAAASPPSFNEPYPTDEQVALSITMTLPDPEINCLSVSSYANYAYFFVSEDPDFESALMGSSRGEWLLLPITEHGDPVITTMVSFTGYPPGTYYIHWYGESGMEGGNGTFGPYIIENITAANDFAITPINQPVTIPVLNNDLLGICNSGTVSLSVTTVPHSGAASVSAGQIVYTPNAGFLGLDSLNYTIDCSGDVSTARVYIYTYPNANWLCNGSSATVTPGFSSEGAGVAWYDEYDNPVSVINVSGLSGTIDYPYKAEVTFPAYLGSVIVTDALSGYHVYVVPVLMYWKKIATNSNWNDPSNWVTALDAALNAVPRSCTTVHIPGDADNYPSLDVDNTPRIVYGNPECDSIIFHFGGEVAKPHLLVYNKALIEYNFGYYSGSTYQTGGDNHSAQPPMERGKWYALATPLNKITPGDFSFGGKPDAWQQAFIRNNISGMFTGAWQDPDNANATDVPEEQYGGIAVWMADIVPGSIGEDASYHTNLNDLQGILRMPYFDNSYLSGKHRIHDYISGMSRFYYYYYQNPGQDIAWTIYDEIVRGSESYRFVFDGKLPPTYISSAGDNYPTFKMAVPAGKELMIGNPFLSNLDFDEFYAINAGSLENDTYRLYVDGGWGYHYSAGGGSWPLTQYIAPLQAFFIQTSAGATELLFPPDLVSVTVPINKLRAAGNRYSNVLYVEASNGEGSSWATLGMKTGTNVDYLFNNDSLYVNVPQIYVSDGNRKNAVQFISGETEIPLGIRSQSDRMITLRFMNVDRFYVESLELQDKVSGDRYDLLRGTNEIEFSNFPDSPDRFLLKVGKQTVGTGVTNKDSGVLVRVDKNKLFVESSEIIRQIVITNMQGIPIFNNPSVNATHVTIDLNVPSGIYIVNVMLENGESRVGKVVVTN